MLLVTNAKSVFAAIEKIAATPSKIEKEALIKQAGQSPLFMRVCKAAYDPFITYGMRTVPYRQEVAPGANTLDEEAWWTLLDDLATRKLSGTAAWEAVQRAVNFLDEPSGELLIRIIRKDLRAGFTDGTINRVFKGTIAEFPYMRCSLPDKSDMPKWDWSKGILSQEKADGMFVNVNHDDKGSVWLTTRQGSPVPLDHLPELDADIRRILKPGFQYHGEITVFKEGQLLPREEGNGMLNSICQGGALDEGCTLRIDLWDCIPLSAVVPKGKHLTPYQARFKSLLQMMPFPNGSSIGVIPTRLVKSRAEAFEHYRDLLRKGKEGTICKALDAIWKDGTSKEQVKLKLEVDVDLEIVNILEGTPGTKNEGRPGSLECRTVCGGLSVNVTVKNEAMRESLEKSPDDWIGKIIVVRSNSIISSESSELYSLFLPRFVEAEPRIDKTVADDLEQVRAIFRNAVESV